MKTSFLVFSSNYTAENTCLVIPYARVDHMIRFLNFLFLSFHPGCFGDRSTGSVPMHSSISSHFICCFSLAGMVREQAQDRSSADLGEELAAELADIALPQTSNGLRRDLEKPCKD